MLKLLAFPRLAFHDLHSYDLHEAIHPAHRRQLDSAEIPPGEHHIRVDVKDTDGQSSSAEFTIKVSR